MLNETTIRVRLVLIFLLLLVCVTSSAVAESPSNACIAVVESLKPVESKPEELNIPARELRFARPFQKVVELMNSSLDTRIVIENLVHQGARSEIFVLESLGRLYLDSPLLSKKENKVIAKFNERMENLEDILGTYSDSIHYLKAAVKMKAPQPLIDWLKRNHDRQLNQFKKILSEDGWLPTDPRAFGLYAKVSKIISGLDAREDDNQLLDRIASYLEKDAATVFDIHNLEKGIHPLRRHLRWFMLMVRAVNGLIQYKKTGDEPVWTHPKLEPDRVKEYSEYPVYGRQRRIVWIDDPLGQTIANMDDVLGLAKDTGQYTVIYARGLLESHVATNQRVAMTMAKKLVAERPDEDTVDPTSTADNAQNFLQENQTREKIARQIRRAIR